MRTIFLILLLIPAAATAQPDSARGGQTADIRQLTMNEAVETALENNLGIRVARLEPEIQDAGVAQARAAWVPTFTSVMQGAGADTPNNSFLSGALGPRTSDRRVSTNVGVGQALPWGGTYNVGWDSVRSTTTNIFSNFSPQLRSSLALSVSQPLVRGFSIDAPRQQLLLSEKNREIADVTLREAMSTTGRAVRLAYWDLVYARASFQVQVQSLDLARRSLQETRARIEVGTTAPIDVVEAEAEVATREEAVIVAEAQIGTAEDALRTLVYDPSMPGFWTLRIEPVSLPAIDAQPVDGDAAVRRALERRTDLQQTHKNLESADINLRYLRNQTLPDVTASLDYSLTGLGGTQFERGAGFPGPVVGESRRGFVDVLRDVFANDFPSWTASLTVSYPIGAAPQELDLARTRLQYSQLLTDLRNQELRVATEVRETARQVTTNQRRIDTTRASRLLAERRLEAEERKFSAGTSTSFLVFQAQRDLSVARNNELLALLDYSRSVVDFETVQEAPLR